MRVIFLDIDGVLNSHQSAYMRDNLRKNLDNSKGKKLPKNLEEVVNGFLGLYYHDGGDMCPLAISNLEYILLEHTDVKIVISSSWRLGEDMREIKKWFKFSRLIPERIIDTTPVLKNAPRGDEIRRWLLDHWRSCRDFVVLDDDTDMDAVEDNFIHVDNHIGLDWKTTYKVINHFNRSKNAKVPKL